MEIFLAVSAAAALAVLLYDRYHLGRLVKSLSALRTQDTNRLLPSERSDRGYRSLVEEVNGLLESEREARRILAKKENLLEQAMTHLSHDIRTPLTGMRGYLQLLEDCGDEEKRSEYLKRINERFLTTESMLENVFLYTKLSEEEWELAREELNLKERLLKTLLQYVPSFEEKGWEPQLQLEEARVLANGEALERVFSNLIRNILVHSPAAPRIGLRKEAGAVLVSFCNPLRPGAQIDPKLLFERFYKAESSRGKGNSGLGLSIVQLFMKKMGGEARASAENGLLCIELLFLEVEEHHAQQP